MKRSYAKNQILEDYDYIDEFHQLEKFADENKGVAWMGFDTEFVGEKRYHTLLCLIQVVTVNGYYLIDPIKLDDLTPFLKMLENPDILKITHAGENDYRLLYIEFGTLPKNLFDTQVAAGFVGYKYPVSFGKLVENEIGVNLRKGYTVSDWESRPINQKQLRYALDDVIYLEKLWNSLTAKLIKMDREEWAAEELKKFGTEAFYYSKPHKEALNNNLILNLKTKDKVFMIRLYEWRRSTAEAKNYSKEMILPSKYIGSIVRHINSGRAALKNHRRIPKGILDNHLERFLNIYNQEITAEEQAIVDSIPRHNKDFSGEETIMELLTLLIKHKCHQKRLAPGLLIYGSSIKQMKADSSYFDERLSTGWRADFIGDKMILWLKNRKNLDIDMQDDQVTIRMND